MIPGNIEDLVFAVDASTMNIKLLSNDKCEDLNWSAADFSKIEAWTEICYDPINGRVLWSREIKTSRGHNSFEIKKIYGPGRIF